MTQRDYYDILGIPRTAGADEIRKAYREKARAYHPDVNKDADAPERFAEVQEAYDVLSDAEKRKAYDRFGHAGVNAGAAGGGAGPGGGRWSSSTGGGPGFDPGEFGSIFEEMFGGRGGPFSHGPGAGGRTSHAPRPRKGGDVEHALGVSFMTAALGGTETLRINTGSGPQEISVKIPPGTSDGAKLRVRGKGRPGMAGSAAGDVILTINVGRHPHFERDGLDLLIEIPITIAEAVMGVTVSVPLLDGNHADLRIPPGSSSGRRLRIKGQGLSNARETKRGDYIATISIVAPKPEELSEDHRAAIEQLREHLDDPRASLDW